MSGSLLTVVICTHNRVQLLARTIASLNAARRPADGVELLVVANHCSDGTHAWLEAQVGARAGTPAEVPAGGLPLRWLAEPAKGKSHALNLALRTVKTPLLTFVDDDQRADAGFLQAICDAARATPEADLFCGRLLPDWDGSEPAWVHDQGRYRIYPLPVPNFDLGPQPQWLTAETAVPSGGNIVVRRPWVERVGPFSTALGPVGHDLGGSEDSEWFLRALQLGARLRYEPGILQRHHIEPERLALGFLMRLTCRRTASTIGLPGSPAVGPRVPLWAWRKLAGYALMAATSPGARRRRFYLMRSAAAWGEISGWRRVLAQSRAAASAGGPVPAPTDPRAR